MKLSRKFISDYIELDENLSIKDIAEDMTRVGNEYDSAESLVPSTKLIIGEIYAIGSHALANCKYLKHIEIPDTVEKIKERAECDTVEKAFIRFVRGEIK